MSDKTTLVDTIRSLSKDTAVTITTADGVTYDGRVRTVTQRSDGLTTTAAVWNDEYETGRLDLTEVNGVTVDFAPFNEDISAEGKTVVSVETHGIVVDQNEPVISGGFPKKVADCPECGGLMRLTWGDMKQSFDYYGCRDCGAEETFNQGDSRVRNPTRREWVEFRLADDNAYRHVPERYLLNDEEPKGYYYKEWCPEGHYQRCAVGQSGDPRAVGIRDSDLGSCPECGNDTESALKTYDDGMDEWGEPETYGDTLDPEFVKAVEAVRTGRTVLRVSIPDDQTTLGPGYPEAYLTKDGDRLIVDIVNGGTPVYESTEFRPGRLAYWFKEADDPCLITPDEYEKAKASPAAI